jgi:hypothetical protein
LSPVGSGSQLSYSILRVSTSTQSANNDSCTVQYLWGDFPDTAYAIGETYAQSIIAYTTTFLGQQFGAYGGQLPGAADTTGTSVAGIGAALPGGSVTDIIPWAGSGNAGGQTGPVNISDYSALQGLNQQDPQLQYGWAPGSPATDATYGGGSPLNYAPSLGNMPQGNLGSTPDPQIIDTTIGGGSLYTEALGSQNGPVYRNPVLGVAGFVWDTTLTDKLGNQINASPLTDAAYAANPVITDAWGTGNPPPGWLGAPSAPVGLNSQVDTQAAATAGTNYYLSQAGLLSSSVVLTNTTSSQTMVLGTDYTLTVAGNGPDTYAYYTPIVAAHFANGNNISAAYSYGTPQYWDSNTPASVPAAPAIGATTQFTQTAISFTATPVALTQVGIVTPPGSLVVTDTAAGANLGKVQVLNLDYTIVVTGSGSTTSYTIARLAGSTNSTSGDTVSVVYNTGNANYFTYGPCLPVNRGVQVNWGPPAGTTEVDYYLIQVSPGNLDLGTQYVPKSGQPGFYGQPSVAGTDNYGQPVFQSDTLTLANGTLATPVIGTITHGGTPATTTYGYRVSAVNNNGQTLASTEVTTTTGAVTLTAINTNIVPWTAIVGATSYNVFGRTAGAELFMTNTTALSFTDTGAITPSGALPASNTTQATLSKAAIITPPGQVIVSDLNTNAFAIEGAAPSDYANETPTGGMIVANISSTPTSLNSPTTQVLLYGVDYTITVLGVGPWTTYQINYVPGSTNGNPGDPIRVDYWYDLMGDVPLTASAPDTVVLVAGSAALLHGAVITLPQNLIVVDTTITKSLQYGVDYTVTAQGLGPTRAYTISLISGGRAGAGNTDTLHVYYLYGSSLCSFFTQGLIENTPVIYKPTGAVYAWQGYQFQIAAGNRAGLGPFSAASDFIVPLNYQAPQPGFEGTTQTITFRDPANSVNPVYLPSGAILSGTGLGI